MKIEFKLEHDGERLNALTIADALAYTIHKDCLVELSCILEKLVELDKYRLEVRGEESPWLV